MIAPWLTRFFTLAEMPEGLLRATLASLTFLRRFPRERAAIAYELAVRGWARAVEARLGQTIGWCRGGRS